MISFLSNLTFAEKMPRQKLDRITGRKVAILGMARSGLALAKLLKAYGAKVLVSDVKPETQLAKEIQELKRQGIEWETGGHSSKVWTKRDYVVVSPGIPGDIPALQKVKQLHLPVFSEIEVAAWLCQGKIIGITGSNGKTTTTTLVGEILKKAGWEVAVAGNVGEAFSNLADRLTEKGWAVLELSSFQLEKISEFKPHTAALLNLSPDHLDRYPNFETYISAKLRIFENQTADDYAVLNADDAFTEKIKGKLASQVVMFSAKKESSRGASVKNGYLVSNLQRKERQIIPLTEIGIKGPHNLSNAACATAIACLLEVDPDTISSVLRDFKGVEHRLEEVATVKGVRFVNDSKATNVDSVWYALQSVSKSIILIAGGKDKGSSYLPLADSVKQKVKLLVLIGQAAQKIEDELGSLTETVRAPTLEQAVESAFQKSNPADTVLLSPACASFDMFENFEHRGRVFKQAVSKLQKEYGQ